jgi:hypothetical protein
VDGPVGALRVAQQVEDGLHALQARLDPMLGGAREDLGLDFAHARGDLDGAGGGEQVGTVGPALVSRIGRLPVAGHGRRPDGGRVGQPGLPVPPVVLVLVDLGQERVEALQVASRDHAGGHELAQGLQVRLLGTGPALDGRGAGGAAVIDRGPGAPSIPGVPGLTVGGVEVGQELGVDAVGAADAAGAQNGVDDLLPRDALGDPEGGAGAAAGPGLTGAVAVTVVTVLASVGGAAVLAGHIPLPGRR